MTIYFVSASTLIKGTFGALVLWLVELLGVESKKKKIYTEYFLSVKLKTAQLDVCSEDFGKCMHNSKSCL